MSLHPWKVIAIIEIAYYAIIFLISLYPTFVTVMRKTKFRMFYIRYYLLVLSKLASGALVYVFIHQVDSSYDNTNEETNLLVAAAVLNSVALGFIMFLAIFTLKYIHDLLRIEDDDDDYDSVNQSKVTKLINVINSIRSGNFKSFKGLTEIGGKLILIAIILNIVAYSFIQSDRSTSRSLQEAGSIIYLACLMFIVFVAYRTVRDQHKSYTRNQIVIFMLYGILAMTPFVLVRIIDSIAAAFNFTVSGDSFTGNSKFSFLFGDWKIYAFMAFLEECIAVGIYTLMTWINLSLNDLATVDVGHKLEV